jgi:hypothetical protein
MLESGFKLLLVSYYFPPSRVSGSIRSLKFAKYLQRNNWDITVVTSNLSYQQDYDESLDKELSELKIEVVRVEEKKSLGFIYKFDAFRRPRKIVNRILNYISNFFFVPDNKIYWAKKVKLKVEELLKQKSYDVILVSCPPFSVFSELTKIKSSLRVPIVVDYRDLWFGSYYLNNPTPLHRIKHKKLEYKALKTAEKVVVSNRKIKEKLIQYFPFLTFESVTIIEHGFDADDFTNKKSHPRTKDKLVLLHYGDFNSYSSAKYFLKAFHLLKKERPEIVSNIELHFIGEIGKENKRLIRILDLHEFIFNHGVVSYQESILKILSADVTWLQIDKLKNNDAIVPAKLFYYFAAQKPVIGFVNDGAAKMLLDSYEASFISSPDDIKQIKETIIKVYELYKANALPKVSEQNIEKFRKDLLIESLLKILQSQVRIV